MSTIYTDQLFNMTTIGGITSGGFFTTSSASNELQLLSAGSLNLSPIAGILFNQADWSVGGNFSAGLAAAPATITVVPYLNGAHNGDAPSTFTVTISASTPIPFSVFNSQGLGVNLLFTTGTTTYAADVSAATVDISSKNKRRLWSLGVS